MTNTAVEYRNKTFFEFWKSERLPFLLALAAVVGLGVSVFLIVNPFQKGSPDFKGGLFFLVFTLCAYLLYFRINYGLYKKGHLMYSAIIGKKSSLKDLKIYNGNKELPTFNGLKALNKGFSYPIYDFNKADVILTEYSLILLGFPARITNLKYYAPIELSFNDTWTDFHSNRATIIDYEVKTDRVILHVQDVNYKKQIKVNIKSEVDTIKQWLTSVIRDDEK